jgi:putative ABC transport system permease protein
MSGTPVAVGPVLVAVLVLLTAAAGLVITLGRIGDGRAAIHAALRAAGQLAAVALVIAAVVRSLWLTALFGLVMFAAAAVTSAKRIGSLRTAWRTAGAIGAGVVPVFGLLVATGAVVRQPIVLVPVAGILIGGAMTATSQAGLRAVGELRTRHGEYEAALALGFPPRGAALEICRPSAIEALIPPLDQTRTVGLVTLPGAFVGVLLGGGGPVQAGIVQLLVLVALLAAESGAVLVTVELVARGLIDGTAPG